MSTTSKTAQRHAKCVEHVKVEGYSTKVCILAGQDREEVLAFAKSLVKGAQS
jgi:hypothetical protein